MDRNEEGADRDCKNTKTLETNVHGSDGGRADGDNPKDRTGGKQTTGISWSPFHFQALVLRPLAAGCIGVLQQISESVMSVNTAETLGL